MIDFDEAPERAPTIEWEPGESEEIKLEKTLAYFFQYPTRPDKDDPKTDPSRHKRPRHQKVKGWRVLSRNDLQDYPLACTQREEDVSALRSYAWVIPTLGHFASHKDAELVASIKSHLAALRRDHAALSQAIRKRFDERHGHKVLGDGRAFQTWWQSPLPAAEMLRCLDAGCVEAETTISLSANPTKAQLHEMALVHACRLIWEKRTGKRAAVSARKTERKPENDPARDNFGMEKKPPRQSFKAFAERVFCALGFDINTLPSALDAWRASPLA